MRFRTAGLRPLLVCTLLALHGLAAHAHTPARLRGRAVDARDRAPIAGVNILVKGTAFGAATGADGSFSIAGIPPGTYEVRASALGFATLIRGATLEAGRTTEIELSMEPGEIDLTEVLVEAERPYTAASSATIRRLDMMIRPAQSSQDLLRLAPGLIIAQHNGGGKAEQLSLRGFDADHGTDVAVLADGVPVNMVSHAHGQGYADLHFLIPEVVDRIAVSKGPYFAGLGDFATAGAVAFTTKDHLGQSLLRLEGGEFSTARLTAVLELPTGTPEQNAYLAGQFYRTDGPFDEPLDFTRFNVFGKFHTHVAESGALAVSLGSFSSAWDASGQIPDRAVRTGQIGRFGAVDPLEGGTTSRSIANLEYTTGEGSDEELSIAGYAHTYRFKLFANFTFFLDDTARGDMIEQDDARTLYGMQASYRVRRSVGGIYSTTAAGGGVRMDDIGVRLWKSPDRERVRLNVDSDVFQRNLFLWVEQEFVFSPEWRVQIGMRGDYMTFDVDDRLDGAPDTVAFLPHASGYAAEGILSPKLNVVFSPWNSASLYANVGTGFHSNDARAVVIARRTGELQSSLRRQGLSEQEVAAELERRNLDPGAAGTRTLPRATGAELGLTAAPLPWLVVGAAAWWLRLEEELVYVGDEGTTEVSGRSARWGLDLEARVSLTEWLLADADVNLATGRFVDAPEGEDNIPLAPRVSSSGGLTARHPSGVEASLRYRFVGDRPANEANTVTALGSTVVDLGVAYRFGLWTAFANLENVLNTAWNEAQFDTFSRLKGEPAGVSELHYTPGNPRNLRAGIELSF